MSFNIAKSTVSTVSTVQRYPSYFEQISASAPPVILLPIADFVNTITRANEGKPKETLFFLSKERKENENIKSSRTA